LDGDGGGAWRWLQNTACDDRRMPEPFTMSQQPRDNSHSAIGSAAIAVSGETRLMTPKSIARIEAHRRLHVSGVELYGRVIDDCT
jgi:hypothetical protein